MAANLQRALPLFQQSRHELAERELRQALAAEPNDPTAHALLGLCLAERERFDEAEREAGVAIGLAPDLPFAHYALARVLHDRGRLGEAAAAIEEALRLDPKDADYYGRLAAIRLDQRRWGDALDAAEEGLRIEPEHDACTNLRAMALVQLGRRDEAGATIEGALARDPENAASHANLGWSLLHGGDHTRALEHFRVALRLDPTLEWAQAGLVEALKARYPLYGQLLRFFLWNSRLSGRAQWGLALVGVFGFRFLRGIANANPALSPIITPILVLYGLFVYSTWLAEPLYNLLLRLNRFGRLALSREEVVASNWVGGCLGAALVAFAIGALSGETTWYVAGGLGAALALPLAGTFQCQPGWPRKAMAAYTGLAALVGLVGLVWAFAVTAASGPGATADNVIDSGAFGLLVIAWLAALFGTWLAKGLSGVRPTR